MPDIEYLDSLDSVDSRAQSPSGVPCDACGTPVELLDKFCPACGVANPHYVQPSRGIGSAGSQNVVEAEVVAGVETSQKHFRCDNCGSEMTADPQQRSYVCPFCDSTYVVEFSPSMTGRQRPEFVIGFSINQEQALGEFQKWLRQNSWFRPGDLSQSSVADKLKGIYLPFWSFSMLAQSNWRASIGEHWYRTETYTTTDSKGNTTTHTRQVQETEWWPAAGKHHRYYSGYLVSGSKGLPQTQAERVMPFQLPALKRYEPYFLAGWLSEEYSVEREQALELCKQEFYRREQQNIGAFLPGDTHRSLEAQTSFEHVNSDLILLPVYLLTYRYQDKLYRFLLNGQTGKMEGDKPVSWQRISIAVGIGVAILAAIAIVVALLANG
jgi:Zn finger protein HypA/HybF involved in hydrogenase expression